jgi:NADPH-dependent curcumin reductase CurA
MFHSYKIRALGFGESVREAAEIIEEVVPNPTGNQVVIANKFVGVNGLFDRAIVRNELPYRFLNPPIDLGVEAIGTVVAIGESVQTLRVGDAVSTTRFGQAYRTFQIEDASRVVQIPSLNPAYVALRPTAVSALVALEQVGQIKQGETVAVTAAAGGLGQFVVQFAQMYGCRVVGIAGGKAKTDFLHQLKCDTVIDYRSEDVSKVLSQQYPQGINLVYDTVGGELFDVLVDNLANRGRLVVSGYASDMGKAGLPALVNRPRVYEQIYWKAADIRCFQNALYPEFQAEASQRILDWYAQDRITVSIDSGHSFKGLESVFDAIEYHCAGKSIGKMLVEL